jgi:hypothetical protein
VYCKLAVPVAAGVYTALRCRGIRRRDSAVALGMLVCSAVYLRYLPATRIDGLDNIPVRATACRRACSCQPRNCSLHRPRACIDAVESVQETTAAVTVQLASSS